MAFSVILFFLSCLIYGCQAQAFYSCGFLRVMNCTEYPTELVCGSNGVTYNNRCELGKTHCSVLELHLQYEKACDPFDFTTPHPTATSAPHVAHGDDVVFDVFCAYLPYATTPVCPEKGIVIDLLCATDGRTYENFCEYEKAKCTHRELHVKDWGNCTSLI